MGTAQAGPARGGARGGKIVQPQELRHAGRELVLAVDGVGGTLRWAWTTSLKRVARAPGRAVGLATVSQPAASQEGTPAERVLQAVRRAVAGRTAATLADRQQAVAAFLRALAAAPNRLRSLAGWTGIAAALQPAEKGRPS